ncbi:unnamed protein product [Prunus armeniaca]
MSFDGKSLSPSSQVPLYLWGGSKVYKERFVANLHHVTIETQFLTWRATFNSAISKDMHVKLVKSLTEDLNNSDAQIITFYPFYFSLGFMFPLSKFFREMLYAMECAPNQCTSKVYRAIICFKNLSRFFKLAHTVQKFFYFFKMRHYGKYA